MGRDDFEDIIRHERARMDMSWRTSPRAVALRARYGPRFFGGIFGMYAGVAIFSSLINFGMTPALQRLTGTFVVLLGLSLAAHAITSLSTERARFYEDMESRARGDLKEALTEIVDVHDLLSLMKANRKQMDAYDAIARSQADASYRASRIAMFLGLVALGGGISVSLFASSAATKYSAAILTATGAAVGGYIAKTFIEVQQNAMEQLSYYFQQPLVQSYLLAAERVATTLTPKERDKASLAIITAIVDNLLTPARHQPDETTSN